MYAGIPCSNQPDWTAAGAEGERSRARRSKGLLPPPDNFDNFIIDKIPLAKVAINFTVGSAGPCHRRRRRHTHAPGRYDLTAGSLWPHEFKSDLVYVTNYAAARSLACVRSGPGQRTIGNSRKKSYKINSSNRKRLKPVLTKWND